MMTSSSPECDGVVADRATRQRHLSWLVAELEPVFATATRDEWLDRFCTGLALLSDTQL